MIAVETDRAWAKKVENKLKELKIENVILFCIPKQRDIELFLNKFDKEDVTIFSVDTVHGYNRSEFTNVFLEMGLVINYV